MHFALNEDQIAVRDMARDFAAEQIAPHAARWDEEKYFPIDVMHAAAKLGIGGIYIHVETIVRDLRVHQILGTNEMRLIVACKMIEGAR